MSYAIHTENLIESLLSNNQAEIATYLCCRRIKKGDGSGSRTKRSSPRIASPNRHKYRYTSCGSAAL